MTSWELIKAILLCDLIGVANALAIGTVVIACYLLYVRFSRKGKGK